MIVVYFFRTVNRGRRARRRKAGDAGGLNS